MACGTSDQILSTRTASQQGFPLAAYYDRPDSTTHKKVRIWPTKSQDAVCLHETTFRVQPVRAACSALHASSQSMSFCRSTIRYRIEAS
jgi:hypothetical protein